MKAKLKDVVCIITDKKSSSLIDVNNYVSTENILPNREGIRFPAKSLPRISKILSYQKNDVLVSNIRPYFKKIWFSDRDGVRSNDVLVFRTKNSKILLQKYLYLLLQSDTFFDYVNLTAKGTKMPRGDKKAILNFTFELPSISTQKKLTNYFFVIESLIKLNNLINDNLLELAKAKFNQTYILPTNGFQKVPLGWECSKLDKIITFSNGYNFKRSDMLKAPEPLTYRIFKQGNILIGGGLNDFGTKSWILKSKVKNLDRFVLKKWDLLMAMTDMKNKVAILGNTALMNRNNQYILNQRVGLIRSNNYNNISQIYLFLLTNSKSFLYNIRSKAHSGVQVNLSTKDIKKINLIIAPEEVNNNFNRFAKPVFEKMMENQVDNLTLNKIKQALLNNFF